MITPEQYFSAMCLVHDYLYQESNKGFKTATLLGIYDDHHDYSYLEIGKEYEIYKWISRRRSIMPDSFIVYINGVRHQYKSYSNMMSWEFKK